MQEQSYTPETIDTDGTLYPAEGRVDVAEGVEEEQRNAYSANPPSQAGGTRMRQAAGEQSARAASRENLPPVEGRVDVASDLEEEQRNAYSAHHH